MSIAKQSFLNRGFLVKIDILNSLFSTENSVVVFEDFLSKEKESTDYK